MHTVTLVIVAMTITDINPRGVRSLEGLAKCSTMLGGPSESSVMLVVMSSTFAPIVVASHVLLVAMVMEVTKSVLPGMCHM